MRKKTKKTQRFHSHPQNLPGCCKKTPKKSTQGCGKGLASAFVSLGKAKMLN